MSLKKLTSRVKAVEGTRTVVLHDGRRLNMDTTGIKPGDPLTITKKPSKARAVVQTLYHTYDRATLRAVERVAERRAADRWTGIGDPNALADWRDQERRRITRETRKTRTVMEAVKKLRVPRIKKEVAP